MGREIRTFNFSPNTELRADGEGRLVGYCAMFNSPSEPIGAGGFIERIIPGCFSRTLKNPRTDVAFLLNHDPNKILGRQRNGSLKLAEDNNGLHFEASLPKTQEAKDILELVRRGDISGCSFAFQAVRDHWNTDWTQRELLDVDLFDVGPATYPAYPDTGVYAQRSQNGGDVPRFGRYEFRRRTPSNLYIPAEDQEMEERRQRAELELLREQIKF